MSKRDSEWKLEKILKINYGEIKANTSISPKVYLNI